MLVTDYLSKQSDQIDTTPMEGLTIREEQILGLVVQGCSNEEIASQFTISKHTVARHRENIMRKLNLHNRTELVKYAIRKGLIEP